MINGQNNLRRAHLSSNNGETSINDNTPPSPPSNTMRRRKKSSKSILSLSCQRWMVRFLSLRKTSQVFMAVIVISFLFLLPVTIYCMSSLSLSGYNKMANRERKPRGRRHNGNHNDKNGMEVHEPESFFDNEASDMIYRNHGVYINASLQEFSHRTTFPPLEPRIVRLTDQKHTYQFEFPPGTVTAAKSSKVKSFPLPQKGSHELRSRYVPLQFKDPPRLSAEDSMYLNGCEPIDASWQTKYHPTCNIIHEASGGWQNIYRMPTQGGSNSTDPGVDYHPREQSQLVNQGAFRQVWMFRDAHDGITKRAMKTLRSLKKKERKYDFRNHDRHRRDAIAFEELRNSPLVVDLYASCSNSAVFDYADRGDLLKIFDHGNLKKKTPENLLHLMEIAYNVSMSVHDAHHINEQGQATMAHTDIKVNQFIYQDGYYKLSDFNRVRFLLRNPKTNKSCPFEVGKNGGEYRAPEEYEMAPETEKVDVYSLGNVLYFLLVRHEVWEDTRSKEVYALVKEGKRPKIPDAISSSTGVFEKFMIQAMKSAWIHSPEKRASALQVANIIKEGIGILSGGAKEN